MKVQKACFLEATRGSVFGVFLPALLETPPAGTRFSGTQAGVPDAALEEKKSMALLSGGGGLVEWRVWLC